MKRIKHKKMIIISAIIICLGVLELAGTIPYIVARTAASVYMAKHYPEMVLKFDYMDDFNTISEEGCSVIYKDKDGNTQGFVMYPKQFPIYILFDSVEGQC